MFYLQKAVQLVPVGNLSRSADWLALSPHTTEIVLGEACWHLGGNTQPVHALLGLVRAGAIQLVHPWPGHLERTQELMMKYERMDAAAASLVMLSEIHRNARIITTDRRDFTIYRRFGRQRLPVVLPPS
jgi:hypothetical protein